MIEDDLRAAFARHEELTPAAGPLRTAIDQATVRRRRRRFAVRASGAALAVLAAVSLPALARDLAAAPASALVGAAPSAPPTSVVPDRPLNFLVLGLDERRGGDDHRADSIMVVHIPRDRSRAYLISIPRDLGVEIPGHGLDKLNAAFFYGSLSRGGDPDLAAGAALTARTVRGVTGLTFDGSVVVRYSGLRKVTDAVGGIRICLDNQVKSQHTKRVYPAGCQHLDGAAAMDLLRQRYGLAEGGYDRDRNGQRFVQALLAKVTSDAVLTDPVKVSAILRSAGDGLVVDTGGVPLADLFAALQGIGAGGTVGIGWTFNSKNVNGRNYEQLDPSLSGSLFDAARRDAVAEWVTAHPRQVTR